MKGMRGIEKSSFGCSFLFPKVLSIKKPGTFSGLFNTLT